jgi:hypothetical protein
VTDAALAYHEGGPELSGVVLDALRAAGREVDPLDPDDLAAIRSPRHGRRHRRRPLALLMPDFDERMAGLARNVEEQRVGLIMAVFSRPADSAAG